MLKILLKDISFELQKDNRRFVFNFQIDWLFWNYSKNKVPIEVLRRICLYVGFGFLTFGWENTGSLCTEIDRFFNILFHIHVEYVKFSPSHYLIFERIDVLKYTQK